MTEKRAGNRGKGRKKGTPNKTTVAVKEALTEAFAKLGGVKALVAWAKLEPAAFYALWGKLLPKELTGNDGGPVQHTVTVVVKRDRNFFGRGSAPGASDPSNTNSGESSPVQGGGVRPSVGQDGAGADGGT